MAAPATTGKAESRKEPVFFLSYAHSPAHVETGDRNRRIDKFFDDLSENVAELVSVPLGSNPGFMDSSVESGQNWTQDLLDAVGTCQVFVALLSSRYFESKWCSLEWAAFSRRRVVNAETDRSAIIPVIWVPFPDEQVPDALQLAQRFSPDDIREAGIPQLYESEGILGLMQWNPDAYRVVVWRLAQQISKMLHAVSVEPDVVDVDELRDILAEHPP